MSSVFRCLLDDDITREMAIVGLKDGRDVRREIVESGRGEGGTDRVSGLVLSHHIDVTNRKEDLVDKTTLAGPHGPPTSPLHR